MKDALKYLRSIPVVNRPVRAMVRGLWHASQQMHAFFTTHWPVYGTIGFTLPNGEAVRLWSQGDDFVSTQAYWNGYAGYEGPSVGLFYHLVRRASCFLDVGANVGYYTVIAGCANRSARGYAFEPVPRIFQRLQRNIRLNGLANVTAECAVVGDREGGVRFYVPEGNGMVHAASTRPGWASRTSEIEAPSVTVDGYKRQHGVPRIDVVKMDCEFHEAAVLEGMATVLREDRPVLITEILFPESPEVRGHFASAAHRDIERIMRSHDYCFYLINRTALVRVDRLEYNPDDRNYLFSPKRSDRSYLPYSDLDRLIDSVL